MSHPPGTSLADGGFAGVYLCAAQLTCYLLSDSNSQRYRADLDLNPVPFGAELRVRSHGENG